MYNDGQTVNDYKSVYSWVGDVPSAVERYTWIEGAWQNNGKDTLTFTNDKLSKVEINMTVEGMEIKAKSEYQYSGDLLSSITMSYYFNGTWMNVGTITFTYDEHDNMIKLESSGQYMNSSNTFTYEEGKSNLTLVSGNAGLADFYYYGISFKSSPNFNTQMEKLFSQVLSQR